MFPGIGTAVNVATVLIGSSIGLLLGARLPARTRDTVTDALGLVTLLIGALSAAEVTSSALSAAVGPSAPVLIVLGALLLGGIAGSLLDIEARLEGFGGWLRSWLARRRFAMHHDVPEKANAHNSSSGQAPTGTLASDAAAAAAEIPTGTPSDEFTSSEQAARERFIEGFVTASLIFCVGPLTILGALSDGLGRGPEQLILKSVLDGFASIAFAASLGAGVMASVVAIVVVQGSLTLVGVFIGDVLPEAYIAAITATGGLLLLGVGLRLLQIKAIPVGNLLPALLVAPALVSLVAALQ
ncbi:MAG: DUF554 domain-containing protein [Propionibacteriaceae bacterium]